MTIEQANIYPQGLEGITFRQFSSRLLSSEPGQKLKDEIRYARFKPDHLSNSDWQQILGLDVNNFYHMPLTRRFTQNFLYNSQNPPENWPSQLSEDSTFNQQESELLVLAADFHDIAEAVVSDIPSPLKTDEDRKIEMDVLREMMPSILENTDMAVLMPHVSESIDEVVATKQTKLGKAFRAIEVIGFLRVALRAWRRKDEQVDPVVGNALTNLATAVVEREMPFMEKNSLIYPAVFVFLENPRNKKDLEEIQAAIKKP